MTLTIRVLLDPANPNDFAAAEFDPLIEAIEADLPEADVVPVFRKEIGYGGPFLEVLHVWLYVAETVDALGVSAAVLRRVVSFMTERFAAEEPMSEELGPKRTRVVNLYGPNGRLLKRVQVNEDGAAEVAFSPDETAPHPVPAPGLGEGGRTG